jgi:hypothetical protein
MLMAAGRDSTVTLGATQGVMTEIGGLVDWLSLLLTGFLAESFFGPAEFPETACSPNL